MSAQAEFYLATPVAIAQYELLEIIHPNFSQTYRLVRNFMLPLVVTHEGAVGPFTYTYVPMRIKPLTSRTDLDQELEITIGDLGEIVPSELDRIDQRNGNLTKPTVIYRTYRSDDLTAPLFGPITLQIDAISFTKEGSVFRARALQFNLSRTGEIYSIEEYPMLEPLA